MKLPHFFILSFSFLLVTALHAEGEKKKMVHDKDYVTFQPFTGKVIGTKVRLRTQPNKESPVVKELNSGEMLGILSEQNDFYIVRPSKGSKGYVFRTYVLDNVVEGEKVNIRLFPDTDAPILGRLKSGEKVNGVICPTNNKWLEITLPETIHFFVAKEYVENVGSYEMLAEIETRSDEALHKLNSVFHYARSEIQKPFEEISFETINQKFESLCAEYSDLSEICEKAKEANTLIEETYLQKKIAFLESKSDRSVASRDVESDQIQKLSALGRELKNKTGVSDIGESAAAVLGQSHVSNDPAILEKNSVWQSLEESQYHLWAVANEGKSMEDFYEESAKEAIFLTGIVEPYSRPVKNRPGDFLLRSESLQPLAFLYSTKINLQDLIGKKVTLVTTPRPNNNFAFPAYFVLGVD